MGCCCSEEEDPLMAQYRRAKSYSDKAKIILQLAGKEEKRGRLVKAIVYYGTYIRCMATHLFKEFDRKKKDEMLNVAQNCRRIMMHRSALQHKASRPGQEGCCESPYVPTDPAPADFLQPWEWQQFLEMCKGSGDIETALQKMGLLKLETRETVASRIAERGASKIDIKNEVRNEVSPHISVAGPTTNTNIAGPSTNISGPNITNTTTVSPNMNNAQTGEGSVAPAVGPAAATTAAADRGVAMQQAPAMMMPGMMPMGGGNMGPMMMVPHSSGGYVMMPMNSGGMSMGSGGGMSVGSGGGSGGSGDYAAALMQQQQQMAAANSGGMFYMQQPQMGGMQQMAGQMPGQMPGQMAGQMPGQMPGQMQHPMQHMNSMGGNGFLMHQPSLGHAGSGGFYPQPGSGNMPYVMQQQGSMPGGMHMSMPMPTSPATPAPVAQPAAGYPASTDAPPSASAPPVDGVPVGKGV